MNMAEMDPLDEEIVARLRIEASQGEKDFFPQYVEYFRQDLQQAADDLAAAANEKNAYQLSNVAHRLRGAAGNFGAHPLITRCVQLEEVAKAGRISEVLAILPALRAELWRVEEAIGRLSHLSP